MPYIVVKSHHQEVDRRELTATLVIGRSPECDVTVRDIALSRRHCRIEETTDGWVITELGSKNGTSLNGERLTGSRRLNDTDTVRLGRAKIIFYAGMPDEDMVDRLMQPARPADPHEALAGTVAGFTLVQPGEGDQPEDQGMPCPQPQPKEPACYSRGELQELLTAIASSSWDSIYAEARQPAVMRPAAGGDDSQPRRRVARPRSPIDLSLQASSTPVEDELNPVGDVLSIAEPRHEPIPVEPIAPAIIPSTLAGTWNRVRRWMPASRARVQKRLPLVAAALWLLAAGLGINYWTSLSNGSTPFVSHDSGPSQTASISNERLTSPQVIMASSDSRGIDRDPKVLSNPAAAPATPLIITMPATQPAVTISTPRFLDMLPFDELAMPHPEIPRGLNWNMPGPSAESMSTAGRSLVASTPILLW